MEEAVKTNIRAPKRLDYIDMAKGIGIILVIIGHISFVETHILVWISAFHMPLFFTIAGIMMAVKQPDFTDVKGLISRRVRNLLIPYMWFSVLYFFMDILNLYIENITIENFYVNLISSLTFYGKSVMWFLTALFLAEVYFILLKSRLKDSIVAICVFVIAAVCVLLVTAVPLFGANSSASLWATGAINFIKTFIRAGIVLPFVAAGYFLWKPMKKLIHFKGVGTASDNKKTVFNGTKPMEALLGIMLTVLCIAVSMKNWSVDTNNMILGNPLLYYIGGIAGSFGTLLLCKVIPGIGLLKFFGKNSLIVMATHLDCYILWAGIKITLILAGLIPMRGFVITTLFVIFTLLFESICIVVINKFFPFMLGKRWNFKGFVKGN